MYTATPPRRTAVGPSLPLELALVDHQIFGEGAPFAGIEQTYFTDLMHSFGVECRAELFDRRRNSFTDMTAAMVPRLRPFHDRFDLAILTGVTPDSHPGFPIGRLNDAVPGAGLAFALFDQGVVAPFTALYVMANSLRIDGGSRTMLIVLDQSTLLHEEPVAERLRAEHDSAAVLVFDRSGGLGTVGVPRYVTVAPGEAAARLETEVRRTAPDTVVCGLGLAPHLPAPPGPALPDTEEVVRAPPGLPATGVWAVLAAELTRWRAAGRRVLLADFDEDQRRLSTCTVKVGP